MRLQVFTRTIDKNRARLYFDPHSMGKKREREISSFQKGEIFTLQGAECDDFQMPKRTYEVIKKIDTISDVQLDGLVVKQIGGDESTIFSLTKADCKMLDIDFQPKLQLFPLNMNWKAVTSSPSFKPFNENDFSTYPIMKESELIEKCVIEIEEGNFGIMPRFYITAKTSIQTRNGFIGIGSDLQGSIVTSQINGRGDREYVEFNVRGIDPKEIEGMDFFDLFTLKVCIVETNTNGGLRENSFLTINDNRRKWAISMPTSHFINYSNIFHECL